MRACDISMQEPSFRNRSGFLPLKNQRPERGRAVPRAQKSSDQSVEKQGLECRDTLRASRDTMCSQAMLALGSSTSALLQAAAPPIKADDAFEAKAVFGNDSTGIKEEVKSINKDRAKAAVARVQRKPSTSTD